MLQSLVNFLYRHPRAYFRRVAKFGGLISYQKMGYNRWQMQRAAFTLPPVVSHPDGLAIHFLTGQNYLYQTLFCICSLRKYSKEKFRFILVDDGSFNPELIGLIGKMLPGADIITKEIVGQHLEALLPVALYPALNRKRAEYPHIKKLTDVHSLPGNGWKLVIDSDMLFWKNPEELIKWLKKPDRPVHMVDCAESYGYSSDLMERLAGADIPSLLNVGVIGLETNAIDWKTMEGWIQELEENEGKTYYLEQALSAMLVARQHGLVLDKGKYIVNPSEREIAESNGVLHHYVDLSKKGYYTTAWKKLI